MKFLYSSYIAPKFSTGFTWFYWEFYKNGGIPPQYSGNENNYNGYLPKDLYVNAKYSNYKQEILQHLDVKIYEELVITKAKEYMKSTLVKSMKASGSLETILNYGIIKDTPITIDHIISLILYCDFTTYCTNFSSTFRIIGHENMQHAKKRNSNFWFQSKLFREAIECFGHNGFKEKGPFYSGLDCVLTIPMFNIRLNSPTSCSKNIEVSIRFAKNSGMIITYVFVCISVNSQQM